MKLFVATKNQHKVDELKLLLHEPTIELVRLPDGLPDAVEDGVTFEENAMKKAVFYSQLVSGKVLSDDSGLVVPMLNGEPGVLSARYAGKHGDDEANNERLIERLREVGVVEVPAYFACALAIAQAGQVLVTVEARVSGTVYTERRGTHGFGYDPLFTPYGHKHRYAEMSPEEKSLFSHRAMAVRMLRDRKSQWMSHESVS
ncbi:RdgB/HAM1 family non-canonical purine NTP pyrophosphatase [Alicyclobacillus acidiphilus]|uniref:RdgB/HAM1 family non-canonical purine NTP pyrophosphatase n=1 Tax=Alicyclobacillus acidiphilus TaxID=182455 RepID=UPI000830D272|nr:RdgB/HAM1 family non-canonical purine NTP pyrophosphatase [Alicyclobacillus acidiphilus]